MIIIGLDPGTATTGYGVISAIGNHIRPIGYGVIQTPSDLEMPKRLHMIYVALEEIFTKFKPNEVAIEKLFFGRNTTTAITVGQARGILLLQAERFSLTIGEYTPMQVKQALVGYGNAEKKQVQYMVKRFLNLKEDPKPDDAADALAIAICHAHMRKGVSYDRLS